MKSSKKVKSKTKTNTKTKTVIQTEKKQKQKSRFLTDKVFRKKVFYWIGYSILVLGTIACFVFNEQISNKETNVFKDIYTGGNLILQYITGTAISATIRSINIIVIAVSLNYALRLVARITFHSNKFMTISRLLLNLGKWIIAIGAGFFIFAAWGADDTLILASAGIFTLIIGLGSQTLVGDILAGIFIVFEGDFQVGDIVIIDGWRGEIQAIGIRTTKLIDAGGNIKIVNNSDIRSIINQTKDLSVAKCYVGISYGDRIEKVEKVIADNLDHMREKIPGIIDGPYYKGVTELGESSVNLLFVAKCKEADIYQVQRDLNREIKIVFDDNNINIPFPQLTLSYEKESDSNTKITQKLKEEAKEFVEEQKDLSKHIDDKK